VESLELKGLARVEMICMIAGKMEREPQRT
jgi:hypothetical protein